MRNVTDYVTRAPKTPATVILEEREAGWHVKCEKTECTNGITVHRVFWEPLPPFVGPNMAYREVLLSAPGARFCGLHIPGREVDPIVDPMDVERVYVNGVGHKVTETGTVALHEWLTGDGDIRYTVHGLRDGRSSRNYKQRAAALRTYREAIALDKIWRGEHGGVPSDEEQRVLTTFNRAARNEMSISTATEITEEIKYARIACFRMGWIDRQTCRLTDEGCRVLHTQMVSWTTEDGDKMEKACTTSHAVALITGLRTIGAEYTVRAI